MTSSNHNILSVKNKPGTFGMYVIFYSGLETVFYTTEIEVKWEVIFQSMAAKYFDLKSI